MEKESGKIIRIAIVGPESTGKTTLSEELAKHFNTTWVREYAREYIDALPQKYTLSDIEIIAKKQLLLENQAAIIAKQFLFCDTNLLVTKVWAEFVFNACPAYILENYKPTDYALHLLTDIDIEWEADPQREHPHKRKELFSYYKAQLENTNTPYAVISGKGEERLQNAIKQVDHILNKF